MIDGRPVVALESSVFAQGLPSPENREAARSMVAAVESRGAVPAITAMGLGFFMMHNTLQTQATQMAPEARGTALSIFGFCFFTGQACGVALGAWIVDRYGAPPLFVGAGVALMILGLAFSRRLPRR